MKWLVQGLFWLGILFGLFIIGYSVVFTTTNLMPNYCEMTFMNPSYVKLMVKSKYSYKYNVNYFLKKKIFKKF